jgi:hypothetical protein
VGLRMYVRITIHRAVWWDDCKQDCSRQLTLNY